MARRSNKTAHVLNLIAGQEVKKDSPEENSSEETAGLAASVAGSVPATPEAAAPNSESSAAQPVATAQNISVIDTTSEDPVAELIQQQLASEFENHQTQTAPAEAKPVTSSITETSTAAQSAEPTVTTTPEVTTESTTTTTPEATTEPTAITTPEATTEPNATTTPEATTEPNATTTPEATMEPNATTTSEAVAEPTTTATPQTTAEANTTATTEAATETITTASTEVAAEPTTIATSTPLAEPTAEVVQAPATPAVTAPEPEPDFVAVNMMERIVNDKIIYFMRQFDVCTCDRCVADTIALTLNGLMPKYIVTTPAAVDPLVSFNTNRYIVDVTVEATKACAIVKENPRH